MFVASLVGCGADSMPVADQVIEMRPDSTPLTAAATTPVTLEVGRTLFRQGVPNDRIYVVERGRLDVVRDGPEGRSCWPRSALAREMGPLFGLPRPAMVRARRDAALIGYAPAAFRDFIGPQHLLA